MMMVTYLRQVIEMKVLSSLFLMCNKVWWNDLTREWYIPPNLECSWITSTSLKGTITKWGSWWGSWNYEGNRYFERNSWVFSQCLTDEVNLCLHGFVDDIDLLVMIYHLSSSFQSKIQLFSKFKLVAWELLAFNVSNNLTKFGRAGQNKFFVLFQSKCQQSIDMWHDFINPRSTFAKLS